jgi:hypothetical protein
MLMREGKATAKPTKSLKETEWSSGFDVLQEMLQCAAAKTGHLMNRGRGLSVGPERKRKYPSERLPL